MKRISIDDFTEVFANNLEFAKYFQSLKLAEVSKNRTDTLQALEHLTELKEGV